MEVAVQEVCFSTVTGDWMVIVPESWDCRISFIKHFDDFPEFFVTFELQVVKILLFVFAQKCHHFVSDGLVLVPESIVISSLGCAEVGVASPHSL